MGSVRLRCRALAMGVMALVVWAVMPAVAGAEPPAVRVIAVERSTEAAMDSFCEPQGGGITACRSGIFAAGPDFPPALAATPGTELVIDTGKPSTDVRVSVSRFGDPSGGRVALAGRRIDGRRWAVSMPGANVSASIAVDYADGATSSSFLTLRRIVATTGGVTSVSAYGNVVAWSDRRVAGAQGSSPGAYHLTALVAGKVRRLPVAPRSVPFDVDLGPGEDGRVVAVYSRCAREPELSESQDSVSTPYPPYTRGRGCDLYRFDFATGKERKVSGASTDQASEVLPSIWKDEIAFARVYEQRDGRRGVVPYLYVRPLAGGRSDRQPGGSRGTSGLPGPLSMDLYGRRLSFVWNYATEDGGVSKLRLDTIGGSHRVLDRTRRRGATFLSPQGIDGRLLYAGRDVGSDRADRLLRRRLRTGDLRVAGAPQKPTGVAVTSRGTLFAGSRNDSDTTAIIDLSDAGFFPGD